MRHSCFLDARRSADVERGRMLQGDGGAALGFGGQLWPGRFRIGAIHAGRAQPCRYVPRPMFAICCGYEDAINLDHLRSIRRSSLMVGCRTRADGGVRNRPCRLVAGEWPRLRDVIRLTYTLVDGLMDIRASRHPSRSTSTTPAMSSTAVSSFLLFNACCDERQAPIHVYDTEKSRPGAVVLWPARRRRTSRCSICRLHGTIRTAQMAQDANYVPWRRHHARPEAAGAALLRAGRDAGVRLDTMFKACIGRGVVSTSDFSPDHRALLESCKSGPSGLDEAGTAWHSARAPSVIADAVVAQT